MDLKMILRELDTAEELEDAIRTVVKAVQERGGTGKVTLTLVVKQKPLKGHSEPGVKVAAQVTAGLPKLSPEEAFFFVDADGTPVRDLPGQPGLYDRPKLIKGGAAE